MAHEPEPTKSLVEETVAAVGNVVGGVADVTTSVVGGTFDGAVRITRSVSDFGQSTLEVVGLSPRAPRKSASFPVDETGDVSELVNTLEHDDAEIVRTLSDPTIPKEHRVSVAAMVGYSEGVARRRWREARTRVVHIEETNNALSKLLSMVRVRHKEAEDSAAAEAAKAAAEAAQKAAEEAAAKYNEAFLGKWEQESMEYDKLEAILKKQGFSWPVRKVALSTKLNMAFSVDQDGDMLYSSKVPVQGEQRLKCVDGASLEVKMLGTRMVMVAGWDGDALVMEQTTYSGSKVASTSKITQRYDAASDKMISENDSPEGFYTRTFKRVKK